MFPFRSNKALAILFLIAVHGCWAHRIPAHAYDIRATWQLYDTETNSVLRNVTDGNSDADLHQVNRRATMALVASFTYKLSGNNLHDHSAWVDWTSDPYGKRASQTQQEDLSGGH